MGTRCDSFTIAEKNRKREKENHREYRYLILTEIRMFFKVFLDLRNHCSPHSFLNIPTDCGTVLLVVDHNRCYLIDLNRSATINSYFWASWFLAILQWLSCHELYRCKECVGANVAEQFAKQTENRDKTEPRQVNWYCRGRILQVESRGTKFLQID